MGLAGNRRILVAALAATQTVGYGVLYYAFSVLLTPIATDLHTSASAVTGAFTVSIVVSAAVGIPIGRWLDHHGGRGLMTLGSALGVVAVLCWSGVQNLWQLYGSFALIGLAGSASLYEAAFPVVIAASRPEQRTRAILAVTVVAGFASTIFFPLTGVLLERLGWRGALMVLAALLAVVTIPVHALLVPGRQRAAGHGETTDRTADVALGTGTWATTSSTSDGHSVRAAMADPRFWRLCASFVAQASASSAVGVLLVDILRQAGHAPTTAATLAGLLGVLSVTGRVVLSGVARRFGMTQVVAAIYALQALGIAGLAAAGGSVAAAVVCVIAFGIGFGVNTIAKPAIVVDRYGVLRYATISAAMTVPVTLARAGSPVAGAAVPTTVFLVAAAVLTLASAATLWTVGDPGPTRRPARSGSPAGRRCRSARSTPPGSPPDRCRG